MVTGWSVTSLWQVKVIDATFGNLLLTLPGASFPQWHRQSQRLAYVSTNRIMRYDFTDGSTVQIAAPMAEGYAYLDWYVGGGRNEFLYHNVRGIWKYDAVTATHTQLTFNWHLFANPSGTYVDQSPDWSPTGQRILLERRYLNSYTTLGVILPDGTRFRPLTRANSTTPYIQANGHVDWANNFSAILTPTPTPSRTMTLTPPPILCPPTGPRVPACEALTATPTNTLTPTNTPTPTFTPTPSPVCVFVGFNATYYRAPITFNPPLGSLNYSSSYHYMATKRFVERVDPTRTEDQVWYYIEWLEQVGQPQVNEDLGVWIKAPIAPPTGGSGCQNGNGLPIDTTYTIPNHSWAAFNIATPLFAQWPIDITEICSGTGLREIHALGFGDAASYPRNTHNGIDLYVTDVTNPNDLPTVVVQSIDVGIVVGIGITTWDSREQRYIPDISNTHANWGASSQRYGDPSQEQAGYSVIIRHGHFYVLYGHLHTISDDLWVGKGVSSGTNLGTLGKFNERHLHIEIHSYGSNIAGPNGSLPPTFADLIGVTGILYLLTNQRRTLLHLTSMI
ncbi:MAG: M23 family metallopeptidase [Anaerolineae bacterium]|nr:M23 family metallopeptidase [Anaerolineae bacterium]